MRKISTSTDTKDISLTIYNGGFGAVKETRMLNLTGEETEVVFSDVAQKIETDSLLVEGLNVLEFNYDYDLVDRDKLLKKYIDKKVYLIDRKTGEKKNCRLLSVEGGGRCVLENNVSKEIYIDTEAELVLPSMLSGLIAKPALMWKIGQTLTDAVKVSYLSKGFNWTANYVVEVLENSLNIAGWAKLENQSGTTFRDVKVKLIAGDVNRINEEDDYNRFEMKVCESMSMPSSQAEEKNFFDYHLYTLNNRTTLKDNQTKHINILNGQNVPYKKYYLLDLPEKKVNVVIKFANNKESSLGFAMPQGKIKLYTMDKADDSLEFLGEDKIDHTPKDEDLKLTIGSAFDVTFDFNEIDHWKTNGFEHYKYECIIKNHKEEGAEVCFEHHAWGKWEMLSSTHDYNKKTSWLLEFYVTVPADSETKVVFEYKIDRRTSMAR